MSKLAGRLWYYWPAASCSALAKAVQELFGLLWGSRTAASGSKHVFGGCFQKRAKQGRSDHPRGDPCLPRARFRLKNLTPQLQPNLPASQAPVTFATPETPSTAVSLSPSLPLDTHDAHLSYPGSDSDGHDVYFRGGQRTSTPCRSSQCTTRSLGKLR